MSKRSIDIEMLDDESYVIQTTVHDNTNDRWESKRTSTNDIELVGRVVEEFLKQSTPF